MASQLYLHAIDFSLRAEGVVDRLVTVQEDALRKELQQRRLCLGLFKRSCHFLRDVAMVGIPVLEAGVKRRYIPY